MGGSCGPWSGGLSVAVCSLGLWSSACSGSESKGTELDGAQGAVPSGGLSSDGTGETGGTGQGAGGQGASHSGGSAPWGGADAGGSAMGGSAMGGSATGGSATGGSAENGGSGAGGTGEPEPAPIPVPPAPVIVSGQGAFWQSVQPVPGTTPTITITPDEKQIWYGWGGAFNEAGWDALLALEKEDRDRALALLFDYDDGLGLSWGRIPIGASDYAVERYSLNDQSGDLAMDGFSIARDEEYLIPYVRAAQNVRADIKFWASPWSPPPWMKEPEIWDGGVMKNDQAYLQAYATYLVKWVLAYEEMGIPIDHVQPQAEPGLSHDYPSCSWGPSSKEEYSTSPSFLGTFTSDFLLPALAQAAPQTGVWFGTLSNESTFEEYFGGLSDKSSVGGVGLQWGAQSHVASLRDEYPELLVMQTEHRGGNYPFLNHGFPDYYTSSPDQVPGDRAPNDENYGRESWDWIHSWVTEGVHVYSAWNMVLDGAGMNLDAERTWHQNALLVVDRDSRTLVLTPFYWVFRHVAQYVRPGAVRLVTEGGPALAFRNTDGSLIAIVHNTSEQEVTMSVSDGTNNHEFAMPGYGFATVSFPSSG